MTRAGWARPSWPSCKHSASPDPRRLEWLRTRASEAYYFANSSNLASIDLHAAFGFQAVARDIYVPGVTLTADFWADTGPTTLAGKFCYFRGQPSMVISTGNGVVFADSENMPLNV